MTAPAPEPEPADVLDRIRDELQQQLAELRALLTEPTTEADR